MKEVFTDWWGERAQREKLMLIVAALVLGVALLYSVLWAPASSGRASLEQQLPTMQRQLAQMEAQSQEARSLASAAAGVAPAGTALRDALAASLGDHGIAAGQLVVLGSGVQVQLTNASFNAWVGWLDDIRKRFKVQVSDAHVTAQKPDGQVDVNATLQPATTQP